MFIFFFFFFKQKTAYEMAQCDWSSDVCSSDLPPQPGTPEEGLATLSELLAQDSLAKIIIISGQAEKNNALQAIGAGAYDFLPKPVEVEVLKLLLKRSFHVASLEKEYRQLQQHLQSD